MASHYHVVTMISNIPVHSAGKFLDRETAETYARAKRETIALALTVANKLHWPNVLETTTVYTEHCTKLSTVECKSHIESIPTTPEHYNAITVEG